MKKHILFLFALAIGGIYSFGLMAEEPLSEAEEAICDVVESLDWKYEGKYRLSLSKSTLSVPEGYIAFIGEDARKFHEAVECERDNKLEAFVASDDFQNSIYFSCFNDGYVSISDWNSVNSSSLLRSIQENTEKANVKKRSKGLSTLRVLGWVQEPVLDKHTNTVFWAIDAINENTGESVINSVALRLGRKGFEKVVWVTDRENYKAFGGELDVMLRSHSFDPGYRYSDFSKGDKVASYGIASLVAATVGGKIVKSGGILLGLKKLWGVIFAAIAGLFYKVKGWFKGDSNEN